MMTPKERTAMQQALDTILNSIPHYPDEADEAITALREALEVTEDNISHRKLEQEPVAWFVQYKNRHEFVFGSKPEFIVDGVVEPLYAASVRTKDLTDVDLWKLWEKSDSNIAFARAVIAADREKNR